MTSRLPWAGNPRPLWKLWDEFGIKESKMIGYWSKLSPIKTGNPNILATVYLKKKKALIAIASWENETTTISLKIDWKRLGIKKERAKIHAPFIKDFQGSKSFTLEENLKITPEKGIILIIEEAM